MSHSDFSPIVITIHGETTDEVRAKLIKLARDFGFVPEQVEMPLVAPSVEMKEAPGVETKETPSAEVKEVADLKTAPSGRGRHPKDCPCEKCAAKKIPLDFAPSSEPAPAATPVASANKASLAPTNGPTKEFVMEKMQLILNSGPDKQLNLGKLKAILSKFGASKFSELKEQDFTAFVTECEKRLAA